MLNVIWGCMLLIGILYGAVTDRLAEVTDAALSSAKEAVALCIAMAGIMALWVGLMEIARRSGLMDVMTRKMQPLLHFLFPNIPQDHEAMEYISTNIIANFLGLGWAATPAGLKAMEALARLEDEKKTVMQGIASNEMCTFLILNISSLQLIPVNIIAYRSQYGSVNPTAIVGPAIAATAVSTAVAIAFCKMMDRKRSVS
ncbi:MAG: nucleoside recognition domain-containing protein [Lachnospiraceae bacterium]|jgi:spore maturation protein A